MVIRRVASWLRLQPDFAPPTPSPKAIVEAYPSFVQQLDQARAAGAGDLIWPDVTASAETIIAGLQVQ
jgi:hypothetical protein